MASVWVVYIGNTVEVDGVDSVWATEGDALRYVAENIDDPALCLTNLVEEFPVKRRRHWWRCG